MSEGDSQRIELRLVSHYQFTASFPDVPGTPSVLFDETPPVGDGRGPNATALLGAVVGNCLSATLMSCLRRARVDVAALTASVVTHVARNDNGRLRIVGIDVELMPTLTPESSASLQRCERIFEDYCTVTESVRHGIPVNVSFGKPQRDPSEGATPTPA